MFLKFHPAGGDEQLHEFRPEKVPYNLAKIAEKLYVKECGSRRHFEQFLYDLGEGSMAARKVALWLVISIQHGNINYRYEDIPDFTYGELLVLPSKQELRVGRANIEASDMPDDEKQARLSAIDAAFPDAPTGSDEPDPEPEPDIEEPEGKEPDSVDAPSPS